MSEEAGFRGLDVRPTIALMEGRALERIPSGTGWQYEPKWDGFRCVAFREGDDVFLQSKAEQPLARYFPEVVAALRSVEAERFVLDGEIVVQQGGGLSFDDLLQRIHPAASRVAKLALETPATYIAFDLLAGTDGTSLLAWPLAQRRPALEAIAKHFARDKKVRLSPATTDEKVVQRWFAAGGGALDGVIAKRLAQPYVLGERAFVKVKPVKTADCVVGGFRYAEDKQSIGSLLLGLYDAAGLLHHVGFTSGFSREARVALLPQLEALVKAPGFTGRAPGGPSRWRRAGSEAWEPLEPRMVLEVAYDHVSGERFRHGTRPLRWRSDKAPRQCRLDQIVLQASMPAGW